MIIMKTDKIIMSNIFFIITGCHQQTGLSVSCALRNEEGVRQLSARNAYAEKIPAGGTMDACMDGVSLYLEKNFENKIRICTTTD